MLLAQLTLSESVQEEKEKIVGADSLKIGNPGHFQESWPMTISIGMILVLASLIGALAAATGIGLRRGRPYSWVAGILGLGVGWLLYGIATASSHRKEADKQMASRLHQIGKKRMDFFRTDLHGDWSCLPTDVNFTETAQG
jgi:hypothetical protein